VHKFINLLQVFSHMLHHFETHIVNIRPWENGIGRGVPVIWLLASVYGVQDGWPWTWTFIFVESRICHAELHPIKRLQLMFKFPVTLYMWVVCNTLVVSVTLTEDSVNSPTYLFGWA
jgi:hypothetical protein